MLSIQLVTEDMQSGEQDYYQEERIKPFLFILRFICWNINSCNFNIF